MSNLTFADWLGGELKERGWSPAEFRRKLESRGVTSAKQRLSYWLTPADIPDELLPVLDAALQWPAGRARALRSERSREEFTGLVRARLGEIGRTQRALVTELASHGVRRGNTAYLNRWLSPQAPKRHVLDVILDLLGLNIVENRDKVIQAYALCGGALPVHEHPPPGGHGAATAA